MTDSERTELQHLSERRQWSLEQLGSLTQDCRAGRVDRDDPFIRSSYDTLWAEHQAVAVREGELLGMSPRLVALQWRDRRAFYTSFGDLDPSIPLTPAEGEELERLQAALRDEIETLNTQHAAMAGGRARLRLVRRTSREERADGESL